MPLLASADYRLERRRLGILGLNAWAVWLLVPAVLSGGSAPVALLGAPVAPLALGLTSLGHRPTVALWSLVAAFPAALGVSVALLPGWCARPPHTAVSVVLGVGSIIALWVGAARVLAAPEALRTSSSRPLPPHAQIAGPSRRQRWRSAFIAAASLGAGLLAIAAPLGGREELERHWGDAAPAADTLSAVVAGVLAVAVLTLFIAPATRRAKLRQPSDRQVAIRVVMLLVVVGAGIFTWYVVRSGAPPSAAF